MDSTEGPRERSEGKGERERKERQQLNGDHWEEGREGVKDRENSRAEESMREWKAP